VVVSWPTIVIGTRPREWLIVKSVFAVPGVVPDAFHTDKFMSLSLLLIVEP
jgi:hypothetical protein